jgi:hypothetical protein
MDTEVRQKWNEYELRCQRGLDNTTFPNKPISHSPLVQVPVQTLRTNKKGYG